MVVKAILLVWRFVFGIPDRRGVPPSVDIKTIRKKSFPGVGKVVDVRWEGDDSGTGLSDILSKDIEIANMARNIGNLTVRSHSDEFQGWTFQVDTRFKLTNQHWTSIKKIAEYLLAPSRHS